jgi:hypothetical protein
VLDWLGLVSEAEHPEPAPVPGDLWSDLAVAVIVRQYQPPTADLWRQDTPAPWVRRDGVN